MNHINSKEYLGFSQAKYIENDPVQYKLRANEVIFRESQEVHFHDDIELFFVIDGKATLNVNNEPNSISSGNLVMLMPYHVHSIILDSSSLRIYQCSISLGLLLLSSISRVIEQHISYSLAYGNVVVKLTGREQESMGKDFEEMIKELHSDCLFNTMVGLNIVSKIILLFSRNIATNIIECETPDHSITWKLMQYMNTNFSNDITAKSLATKFSLPPLKINNYFYLLTGENLSTNLHRTRIRYACSMLQFDQLSSSYIGKYVGYKNTSSFFRKFKEIKNMTPDEYRKSHIPNDMTYKCLNNSWKILLYIYEHYAEPMSETSISQALFLSTENIHTELLSNFDMSLPDLITQIRLQYACSFLLVLDAPILNIAYLSGFSSVRTFNRCFKKIMGYTPLEFRKQRISK
ncbi:AraC family transcriptional regulator [Anaeromicropila herbilytica]|uniref:HTH araC/xylS-type domain-containing protein n=1 Tax=Anaeromicropila herbilytica TaxID=2785025 RepID=A0A7R7IDL0_9FIRM|nr:AraC family transcriptional regulator [Anaeromicropila herbilytica]BCN31657.1 hypothetical protein bsdtb5_29520 [Anaeromicropila herbilytica]